MYTNLFSIFNGLEEVEEQLSHWADFKKDVITKDNLNYKYIFLEEDTKKIP